MTENNELIKCSKCKCMKLKTLFKVKETTGILLKTCIKCREKYKCEQCDYSCSTNGHLKQHIKMVHDKIKDIDCEQCDYKCSTNGDLNKHIKQVHSKIKDCERIQV